MLFHSYPFLLIFLPATLAGWWLLRDPQARLALLILASYVFYAWWDWRLLPVLMLVTVLAYGLGGVVTRSRLALAAGVILLLLPLAIFKYADFAIRTWNGLARWTGISVTFGELHLILPVGISFFTFGAISYLVDVRRRTTSPATTLLSFAAFVAMFPHLIAGPIVRFADLRAQLETLRSRLSAERLGRAAIFFSLGMGKKLLLADPLAGVADPFFAAPAAAGVADAWLGLLAFSFQIYFDFSGYSDMAVGLAFLLGIEFPLNFLSPYRARNIADFWHRWHITLSTWLRDYLFIPMGGSRGTWPQTIRNLFITMAFGGLWHGASLLFVAWGLYHGLLLVAHRLWQGLGRAMPGFLAPPVTFLAVTLGWVLFRAADLPHAFSSFRALFAGHLGYPSASLRVIFPVLAGAGVAWLLPDTPQLAAAPPRARVAVGMALVLVLALLLIEQDSPFLYFQF